MASNNNTPPDPIISSVHNLIPQIPRRRKHRNPGIAIAFRLRGSHSKKNSAGNSTSPVKYWEGFQKNEISARKLAAEWWQWQFMSGDVFPTAPSLPSSRYQVYIICTVSISMTSFRFEYSLWFSLVKRLKWKTPTQLYFGKKLYL